MSTEPAPILDSDTVHAHLLVNHTSRHACQGLYGPRDSCAAGRRRLLGGSAADKPPRRCYTPRSRPFRRIG